MGLELVGAERGLWSTRAEGLAGLFPAARVSASGLSGMAWRVCDPPFGHVCG